MYIQSYHQLIIHQNFQPGRIPLKKMVHVDSYYFSVFHNRSVYVHRLLHNGARLKMVARKTINEKLMLP